MNHLIRYIVTIAEATDLNGAVVVKAATQQGLKSGRVFMIVADQESWPTGEPGSNMKWFYWHELTVQYVPVAGLSQ